ncbi:unknown protein [Microcystis aeruginosa NIES-843]|uniref:Uncharacterized protein n=1 Tax=Microcystis aeruginosa (strain NIES-843 / IAM M-2473) TaxID=449447 RepID=B0JSH7_MICAN|nr:unknown protein [Microcystis aeruginosa NIES-843]
MVLQSILLPFRLPRRILPRRLRRHRFSGGVRCREDSVTLIFFLPFLPFFTFSCP